MAKNKVLTKTRGANNEGSIFRRSSDNRWVGSITTGVNENGKQIKKVVYGRTRAEVSKKLLEISGRIRSNSYEMIEGQTFGELMNEWLMVFKKSAVTPRTFEGIIRNFKLHIQPQIGNMKIYEVDTYVVQKVMNNMIDQDYSVNTIKKNKHLLAQFFEYAIDNKWVTQNPVYKVKVRAHDKVHTNSDKYKALTPEIRVKFLEALAKDNGNFIKPLCICLMFGGLRIGEALALKWENVNFENKTLKVERAITQIPKFDNDGKVISRITVIADTKTACSVREIPIADIVVETLQRWREKQIERQNTNPDVTADLTAKNAFIFANDDGSVRTYFGSRKIFDGWKKRHKLTNYNIHFHGLRHTFSNMLFEMNENPKVIQQLLGHRDVKTTITVYNSVDSEYIRQTTDKFNERVKEDQMLLNDKKREEILEQRKDEFVADMDDDEFDEILTKLLEERKERKRRRENDMEM